MPPRREANARSAHDTYQLGVRLYRGYGKTKGEAVRLIRLAADQGLADAQVYFGMMSDDDGETLRQDRTCSGLATRRARAYFRTTAWLFSSGTPSETTLRI
jgi:TPR repeat protein